MATSPSTKSDDLRPEYNLRELLRGGVRGKYAKAYQAGTNVVVLSPDLKSRSRRHVRKRALSSFGPATLDPRA
jgi:hypothetical protein